MDEPDEKIKEWELRAGELCEEKDERGERYAVRRMGVKENTNEVAREALPPRGKNGHTILEGLNMKIKPCDNGRSVRSGGVP